MISWLKLSWVFLLVVFLSRPLSVVVFELFYVFSLSVSIILPNSFVNLSIFQQIVKLIFIFRLILLLNLFLHFDYIISVIETLILIVWVLIWIFFNLEDNLFPQLMIYSIPFCFKFDNFKG